MKQGFEYPVNGVKLAAKMAKVSPTWIVKGHGGSEWFSDGYLAVNLEHVSAPGALRAIATGERDGSRTGLLDVASYACKAEPMPFVLEGFGSARSRVYRVLEPNGPRVLWANDKAWQGIVSPLGACEPAAFAVMNDKAVGIVRGGQLIAALSPMNIPRDQTQAVGELLAGRPAVMVGLAEAAAA